MYANETIWCTQDAIAALFDKARSTIAEHLLNAFKTGELVKDSVCRKFRRTAADGKPYDTQYYNLDDAGSVNHEEAVLHAETEFEKYRIVQDRLFQSDFDKYLSALPFEEEDSNNTE